MVTFINDQPLEHLCSNGLTFKAERCDLVGGILVIVPAWPLTDEQKHSDFLEFGAWHRGNIWPQLNGFAGYDCLKFTFAFTKAC